MTDDELLRSLAEDWKADPVSPGAIATRFAREQRRAAGMLVLSTAGLLLVLGGLAWLSWRAWNGSDALFAVAAAAFALALPLVAAEAIGLWSNLRRRYDRDAHSLLVQLGDELVARRRLLRGARAASAILVAASAGCWLLVALGQVTLGRALVPAITWPASAALIWAWQARRARQLQREESRRRALLPHFADDD